MIQRFEQLTNGVARIYKSIQKIKKTEMRSWGLKGNHVMCLYYLNQHPEGLTAADLCSMCNEDKAGISRTLADLEEKQYITYSLPQGDKKYRAKATLTQIGKECSMEVNERILHAVCAGGKGISEEERRIFYHVLFLIADNLEESCQELYEKDEDKRI